MIDYNRKSVDYSRSSFNRARTCINRLIREKVKFINLSALLPSKDSNLQQTSQLFTWFIQLVILKVLYGVKSYAPVHHIWYSSEDNLFCDFSLPACLLVPLYHSECHLAVLPKIYGVLCTPCPYLGYALKSIYTDFIAHALNSY